MAPVTSCFRWVPYPTTTTSSNFFTSARRVTSKFTCEPTAISLVSYPMKLNTNTELLLSTSNKNPPSASVIEPFAVPFSMTLTPGSGSPVSSSTFPLTCVAATSTIAGLIMTKSSLGLLDFRTGGWGGWVGGGGYGMPGNWHLIDWSGRQTEHSLRLPFFAMLLYLSLFQ